MLSFLLLTLLFAIYLYLLWKNKDLGSPFMILVLFLSIIFYLPILYYRLGFTVYRHSFSSGSLEIFTYVSCGAIFLQTIAYLLIKSIKPNLFAQQFKRLSELTSRKSLLVGLYFFLFSAVIVGYLFVFRNKLPIYALLFSGELLERPDKVGGVPLFYTMSSFYMVIIPSVYLYYHSYIKYRWLHVICVLLVSGILVAGGHKGLIAFFYLFLWFFIFKGRVNLASILLISFLLGVYGLSKGKTTLDGEVAATIAESAIRRFSVTQGLGFIVRIDMMNSGQLDLDGIPFKVQVFQKVYREEVGTCPTVFVANVIPYMGYFVAAVVYLLYCIFIFFFLKSLKRYGVDNYFVLWNIFIILFLTGMTDFSVYVFLRCFTAALNVVIVGFLQRIRLSPSPRIAAPLSIR